MPGSYRKVIVVGAGPAGVAACQQCIREGIDDVLLIEKDKIGGLIRQANRIENFPGFVGEDGREMVEELEKIVSDYEIDIEYGDVEKIDEGFRLKCDGTHRKAECLVLATGTKPKSLDFVGEKYHPEWRDHTGEETVVIGGGDAAYDHSLRIDKLGGEVTVLRRSDPKALPVLVKEARERGIKEEKAEPTEIEKDENGFRIRCEDDVIQADQVITAVGREPNIPSLTFPLDLEDVKFPTGETDIDNLFVIGSTVLGTYRQTSLCWGMGIAAGMKMSKKLRKK